MKTPVRPLSPPEDAGDRQKRGADELFPIVAVGASAGGLEAFTELLRALPADTGMAFVFIQHLAPRHESLLQQLLARETAMPVVQAGDGTVLSPNHVYVIAPGTLITISGLTLAASPRDTAATSVDVFFRSLAASHGSRAIGVVLSGTGSDGALGVQAIAEEGGVVFAEEPSSAKFDGMPRSAIATAYVDFVLPPDGIAAELARIAREPRIHEREAPEGTERSLEFEKDLQCLFDVLRAGTGIEFSAYRRTTVRRRVLRRLALLKLGSLGDYLQYLNGNPGEAHSLVQDLLIRVTRFFRDGEVFDALKQKVFPVLIRRARRDSDVRIWVPGCSTGEEVYSLAICFQEVAEQMQSRAGVQIFGTDINEAAIEQARRGVYIENIAADVSPERLARFFVRVGREWQISRRLRDVCVFSRHDVLNDPPFPRMDLVSCRNVLIYLDSIQDKALQRFHFALNPGGFLLLGKAETAVASPESFATVDKDAKIYVRQESARRAVPAREMRGESRTPKAPSTTAVTRREVDIRRKADEIVLERCGPQRVIVGDRLEPWDYGDAASRALWEAVRKDGEAVAEAVRKAGKSGQSVRIEIARRGGGGPGRVVEVEIIPLGPRRQHFLVILEEHAKPETEPAGPLTPEERQQLKSQIERLEKDLVSTRAHLESIIVDQEAANEEIVASNEELQSMNEELQSSQEELEASNEELTTVNEELQVRSAEAENAREFAQATIDTVRGSLLVLGPDLRVIRANRSFYRAFRLSPEDVERHFIYELGGGRWSNPELRKLLEETLPKNRRMDDFELEQDIPPFGRRILLMNARRFEREERILLAIEDVTETRRVEHELRQSQKMEAIGHLAAGVAHDFNNLLTGVMGNASLMLESVPERDPKRRMLDSIISGAQRAADLTLQLLAYAGKGRYFMERVNLSDAAVQTSRLIHYSIPENVQLRLDLEKDLPSVLADPAQVQQVMMNLVINAAEAIGEEQGTVLVTTGRRIVTDEPLPDLYPNEKVAPGEYVYVQVQDNGSGMDEQTMRRMFDPFFTTKFTGRGLGLAAVLGIVRQQEGAIQVHSVPGRGSSLTVLFPVGEKPASAPEEDLAEEELRGSGTVLAVDDEEIITNYTKSALELYGYTVLTAASGPEAIRLVEQRSSDIDLVLLDVAMPGMDGVAAMKRIRAIRPDVPVVVATGLGDLDVEQRFAGKDVADFLRKPYTVKQLARMVSEHMPSKETGERTR